MIARPGVDADFVDERTLAVPLGESEGSASRIDGLTEVGEEDPERDERDAKNDEQGRKPHVATMTP